MKQRKYVDSC